jgi:hypothetical protein
VLQELQGAVVARCPPVPDQPVKMYVALPRCSCSARPWCPVPRLSLPGGILHAGLSNTIGCSAGRLGSGHAHTCRQQTVDDRCQSQHVNVAAD